MGLFGHGDDTPLEVVDACCQVVKEFASRPKKGYYKVVDQELHSVIAPTKEGLEVQYQVGEFATAPVGGLLCFVELEHAKVFQQYCNSVLAHVKVGRSFQVFRCEAEEPVTLPPHKADCKARYCIEECWAGKYDGLEDMRPWPPGTVAFKRVKLLERVE